MDISKKKLLRYFSHTNYLSSSPFSHPERFTVTCFDKTRNPSLPQTLLPPTVSRFHQAHANPTSTSPCSSVVSTGVFSFGCVSSPISQSLTSLARYKFSHRFGYPSFSFRFLRPYGQFRRLSGSFSDKDIDPLDIDGILGGDEHQFKVSTVGEFGSNVSTQNFTEIAEVIRIGGDGLELKLNNMCPSLSIKCLSGIFGVLNCERVSGLRFLDWARDKNPSLYYNAHVCSLVIDHCGWLDDYESMLCFLKDFKSKRICLSENAFGFLSVFVSTKDSMTESTTRVVELLNAVGGSCGSTGILGLLKMLSKLDLFEMAKFVIEITERKVSYYNILVLEKCRRCCFVEARDILEEMRRVSCDPDAKTYNYLLSSLCKHDETAGACSLLEEMKERGCPPDALTFEIFIYYSCRLGKFDDAVQFFDQMISTGLQPRLTTHAAFIKGYFSSGQYEMAYSYVCHSDMKCYYSATENYSLLAKLHQSKGNLIIAGNILIEMMDKGHIPNFRVCMEISKRLYKSGSKQFANCVKSRFYSLRSESSMVT